MESLGCFFWASVTTNSGRVAGHVHGAAPADQPIQPAGREEVACMSICLPLKASSYLLVPKAMLVSLGSKPSAQRWTYNCIAESQWTERVGSVVRPSKLSRCIEVTGTNMGLGFRVQVRFPPTPLTNLMRMKAVPILPREALLDACELTMSVFGEFYISLPSESCHTLRSEY